MICSNIKSIQRVVTLVAALFVVGLTQPLFAQNDSLQGTPILVSSFTNLYQVNQNVYRSEQPSSRQFKALRDVGVRSVINLRHVFNDNIKLGSSGIVPYHLRINTWYLSREELVAALKLIQQAEKPVLIHCRHGSDRTGAVIAVYRMVFDNWTKEEAIKEFLAPNYGYHRDVFPKILQLVEAIDVEELKSELGVVG